MIRRALGPLLVAGVAGLLAATSAGCATTYDTSATTVPATTSTVYTATGTTTELLAAISSEVGTLSEKLVDGRGQRDALARIEARWDAARPAVKRDRPELLSSFDAAIARVQRAVDRRAPADADKAAKDLAVLIAAYHT